VAIGRYFPDMQQGTVRGLIRSDFEAVQSFPLIKLTYVLIVQDSHIYF